MKKMNIVKKIVAALGSLVATVTPAMAQGPVESTISFLQSLGFAQVLLFLLTFAVVFGVLKGHLKSRASSGIIAIVAGFLVLMAVPVAALTFLSTVSTSLLVGVIGILAIIVFLEVAGVKDAAFTKHAGFDKDGKEIRQSRDGLKIIVALVLLGIAVLVFNGAGGVTLLGISALPSVSLTTIAFVVVVLAAIYWIATEK